MKFFSVVPIILLLLTLQSNVLAKNCTTGKPCGNSCISQDKVCHIGETPTPTPTAVPTSDYNKGVQDGIAQCQANPDSCNISTNDYESGKQDGIKQCQTMPTVVGIPVATGSSGTGQATYNPKTGELYIPFVDVPGTFGDMQSYEVYLQQKSGFTFDLDLTRVKQH